MSIYIYTAPETSIYNIRDLDDVVRLRLELLTEANNICIYRGNEKVKVEYDCIEPLINILQDCRSLIEEQRKEDET